MLPTSQLMFRTRSITSSFCIVVLLLTGFFISNAQGAETKARIMTWVPPYAVETCKNRLKESFNGIGMKDGLTHLGLQFWHPTKDGGIKLVNRFRPIDDSSIAAFQTWGETNNVRVMLCVFNGTSKEWNWELAKSAFDTNRGRFIDTLINETRRLNLGGVDIDFEGKGTRSEDKQAYIDFIIELASRLHAEGKELTVDTFAYKWNAPNQGWWSSLLPHIDGLHVMGYSDTGSNSSKWRSYDFIKKATEPYSSKLLIGVPSFKDSWQETPVQEHLNWIKNDAKIGVAIWDAQLKSPAWRTQELWQTLSIIKGAQTSANQ